MKIDADKKEIKVTSEYVPGIPAAQLSPKVPNGDGWILVNFSLMKMPAGIAYIFVWERDK